MVSAAHHRVWLALTWMAIGAFATDVRAEDPAVFRGRVLGAASGEAIAGAMVSFSHGDPSYSITVFSDEHGGYSTPPLTPQAEYRIRVRRIGWKDRVELGRRPGERLEIRLQRETDPAELAAQLPANRWYALLLASVEEPAHREELKRQCTYCHQQGSRHTRIIRTEEEWGKVLALMGRMGGMLSDDLRAKVPDLFNTAYDLEHAVPALTARMHEPDFAPPPDAVVRRAIVEEWELGGRASMQHDITVDPEGRIYSVDMTQDKLYRLDPAATGAVRETWSIPNDGLPLGGAFASAGPPLAPNANSHVGPHSLQIAPDGSVWITLALGNRLARFDPETERFTLHPLDAGYYPHTLRFDARGRIWFTLAASNHLGMFDPKTGAEREIRLPAGSFGQEVVLRMMPFFLWLGSKVDLRGAAANSDGFTMPIPYGVDIAPDGVVWFSQLNEHRIGRVDPDSFEVEMVDVPFPAPRRLRFDSKGKLWIPSFSASLIARFDPDTRTFESWKLPIPSAEGETPYALHVERGSDTVWVCGTNSDSLIRFEPESERFTVYPLPTRVTYTREIDFDKAGGVWTSNSNAPTWQIEGGVPRIIRLDPEGLTPSTALARR